MDAYVLAALSALWLGVLTSISPCPLATNIAAVSFIGRRVDNTRYVLYSGLVYAAGRLVSYVGIGVLAVAGILSIPGLSFFLQNEMNRVLGPLLLVTGLVLLGVIRINRAMSVGGNRIQKRAEKSGLWGAGMLGLLFALSFCPVSAALFFGSLIPLSIKHNSSVLFPSVYGLGTALPVIAAAIVLAFGTKSIGTFFTKLTKIEIWVRRVTGAVFAVVGAYYTLVYLIGVEL